MKIVGCFCCNAVVKILWVALGANAVLNIVGCSCCNAFVFEIVGCFCCNAVLQIMCGSTRLQMIVIYLQ